MTCSGIKGFISKKEQSQQLTLDDFFNYGYFSVIGGLKMGKLK